MTTETESTSFRPCQTCGATQLRLVEGFGALHRITSDCRPHSAGGSLFVCIACGGVQKIPDEKWQKEVESIYAGYEVYYQSGGEEQIVFDRVSGTPRRRSDVIMDRLVDNERLAAKGDALDVGCGNGVTLRSMSAVLPEWTLSGYELNESALARLNEIRRFSKLYTGSVGVIDRSFDLVTLIHSLEHFPAPLDALNRLRTVVGKGRILIQVCNIDENPFDILVADHLVHFSPDTLSYLLRRAGFCPISVATDWVPKEISVLSTASADMQSGRPLKPPRGEATFERIGVYVQWLKNLVEGAMRLSGESKPLGIFGTSIAATWLASQLEDRVAFFVDEDVNRIGKQHMGRPIVHPSAVPEGGVVYLALAPGIAEIIAERLFSLPCEFVTPPQISQRA